jgi:hypothetical protein
VLEEIGLAAVPELARDDMAPLAEPHPICGVVSGAMQYVLPPGAGRVNEGLSGPLENPPIAIAAQFDSSLRARASRGHERRSGQDRPAALADVHRVEDNQTRGVHPIG